jgi:hypothetical protein
MPVDCMNLQFAIPISQRSSSLYIYRVSSVLIEGLLGRINENNWCLAPVQPVPNGSIHVYCHFYLELRASHSMERSGYCLKMKYDMASG